MEISHQQVAIFIDFENLTSGLQPDKGDRKWSHEEDVDCEPIVRLAEEYGRVVQSHAYADWRNKLYNQYQLDLYKLGIDLVHVMGKMGGGGFKNAVDIKMAVDITESIFTFPDIQTFIIVSGDRDFIHVLKMLRRHGRQVVGISPARSASEDLAQLTDRFIRYESLTNTYFQEAGIKGEDERGESKMELLHKTLRELLQERPEGIKGSELKILLRRNISATFDESDYGFQRFVDLIRHFSKDLRVDLNPDGGDMTVVPLEAKAEGNTKSSALGQASRTIDWVRLSGLKRYRFELDPERRRATLRGMFEFMKNGAFSQNDIFESTQSIPEFTDFSATELSKYFMILFQSGMLWTENNREDGRPVRARKMILNKAIQTPDDLIRRYEISIILKVMEHNRSRREIKKSDYLSMLGLPPTKENQAYVSELVDEATKKFGEANKNASGS